MDALDLHLDGVDARVLPIMTSLPCIVFGIVLVDSSF
jgi:hypothetical protein